MVKFDPYWISILPMYKKDKIYQTMNWVILNLKKDAN